MANLTNEEQQQILSLVGDYSLREIANLVLGRPTRESTVRSFLSRVGDNVAASEAVSGLTNTNTKGGGENASHGPTEPPLDLKWSKAKQDEGEDNSRILIISDMHIPYHHPDMLAFLQYLKDKYNPTRIISMGDELDKHSLSYHDSDPDLDSAGKELEKSLPVISELEEMFPRMDLLESNHGSLVWRKAKTHGIPRHYIKSYNDVLGVKDWRWHFDMTIKLPNGQYLYLHHGKSSEVLRLSQQMGMNAAQGHYHEKFGIQYWGNPTGLYWGLQTGCLINDDSYAFSYNNVNIKRPLIGTAVVIDSQPILEPMVLDEEGRWVGAK